KIDIADTNVQATLGITGHAVGFSDGIIDKLDATVRASKKIPASTNRTGSSAYAKAPAGKPTPATAERPWFAGLRTAIEFTLSGIRYRDYILDSVEGSINGSDDLLGLDRLNVRRNHNDLIIRGGYRLPPEVGNALSQPAQFDVALNAPETGDF